jgi:hypothetical protein
LGETKESFLKPLIHAKNSVKRYGGVIEDYIKIHNWFDSTKAATPNFYHRAILHNSFGIFLCEQLFGVYIENAEGKLISVRDIAEDHVREDCQGRIPTIDDWLKDLPAKPWMTGKGLKQYVESIGMEAD